MAVKKVLTHFDFAKVSEIQNAVIHRLASAPSSPTEGQIYYNTATDRLEVWTGSAWVPLDASQLTAGNGLGRSGNDFSVNAGTNMEIVSDALRPAASLAGNGLTGGGAAALAVNAGSGLEIASDAVRIAGAAAGAGLTGGAGSALAVGAGTGITVNANDVAVDTSIIATRAFAETVAQGIREKYEVRVATTANITISSALNAGDSIDGVTLANGDRVLVKNQTSKKENGIWVVGSSPARADDTITPATFCFVAEGSTQEDTGWLVSTNGTITLGTTELNWVQFSSAGIIIAGNYLSKSGNTLNVLLQSGGGLKGVSNEIAADSAVVAMLAGTQTLSGAKTFSSLLKASAGIDLGSGSKVLSNSSGDVLVSTGMRVEDDLETLGDLYASGALYAGSAKKFKIYESGGSGRIDTSGSIRIESTESSVVLDGTLVNIEAPLQVNGTIDAKNHQISGVSTPSSNTQAANKKYVDDGLAEKPGIYKEVFGDGSKTEFKIEHGLGEYAQVSVYEFTGPVEDLLEVECEVRLGKNYVTLKFNSPPPEDTMTAVVTASV